MTFGDESYADKTCGDRSFADVVVFGMVIRDKHSLLGKTIETDLSHLFTLV